MSHINFVQFWYLVKKLILFRKILLNILLNHSYLVPINKNILKSVFYVTIFMVKFLSNFKIAVWM